MTVLDRTDTRPADASLASYLHQLQSDVESLPTYRPVVAAVIPAYNEGETIVEVLEVASEPRPLR